ncbi:MAG: hypothetical protein CMN31_26335 [Sandaracinus sp.]|nr:hypothetical protein [Sandaracinus sp.]MBJ74805.1 hypothetical protein [Sandaracinus sp.]
MAPVHFELYWDGSSLWVSPPMAGTLTVDGERVQQWRQLAGRCRVEFGRAAFMVESSQSIAVPGAVVSSAPAAAAPEAPADLSDYDDDDATFVYQEAPVADSVPPLQGDATQMVDPSGMAGRPALGGQQPSGGAPSLGAPRLGGSGQAPAPPPSAPIGGGMKTQILDTESLGLPPMPEPGGGPAPAPGMGQGSGNMSDERPTLMASQMPTDVLPRGPEGGAPAAGGKAEATGKFAPPPSGLDADGGEKKKLELPPTRTLILLGVTLVVALGGLGFIMWKKSAAADAAAAAAASGEEQQAAQADTAANEHRQTLQAQRETQRALEARAAAGLEDTIREALEAARAEAIDGLGRRATDEETEAAVTNAERQALEKLAVDALTSNNYRHALVYYQRLAREHPGGPYAGMVHVLRAKVGCRDGVRPDGRPCSE